MVRQIKFQASNVAFAAMFLGASLAAHATNDPVVIPTPPDTSALVTLFNGVYIAFAGLGLTVLGVGYVVYMLRKGIQLKK